MIAVRNIGDCIEWAQDVARLMQATWPAHYGPDGPGDADAAVQTRIENRNVGVALVDNLVCGTVALARTSFGAQSQEGPWLIGLCVAPAYRKRGVGSALVGWAMQQADEGPLYTTTQDAAGVMSRLGWRKIRETEDETGVWSVMVAPPK